MSSLGEYLDSINTTKKNIIRDSDSPAVAEKLYPAFPVSRSLSYHEDCILLIQELNIRGLSSHGISNKMHYEFLLNVLSKRKRFSKWEKPTSDEKVDLIMETYSYSREKAEQVKHLFSDADIELLKNANSTGGKQK